MSKRRPLPGRRAIPLLATGVMLAITYLLFRENIDLEQIGRSLSSIRIWAIVAAVAALIANFAISSQRYRLILLGMDCAAPSFAKLFGLTFVSLFAAHLIAVGPSADMVRVGYGKWLAGLPMRTMVASVIYDRALAVVASIGVGVLAIPLQLALAVPPEIWLPQVLLWAVSIAAMLVSGRYVGAVREFFRVSLGREYAVRQVVFAALHPLSFGFAMWWLAFGMGLDLALLLVLALSPLFILGQSLPLFFVGWGMRETIVVTTLATMSAATASQALALSVATGAAFFLATLPGLPLLFAMRKT